MVLLHCTYSWLCALIEFACYFLFIVVMCLSEVVFITCCASSCNMLLSISPKIPRPNVVSLFNLFYVKHCILLTVPGSVSLRSLHSLVFSLSFLDQVDGARVASNQQYTELGLLHIDLKSEVVHILSIQVHQYCR